MIFSCFFALGATDVCCLKNLCKIFGARKSNNSKCNVFYTCLGKFWSHFEEALRGVTHLIGVFICDKDFWFCIFLSILCTRSSEKEPSFCIIIWKLYHVIYGLKEYHPRISQVLLFSFCFTQNPRYIHFSYWIPLI